MTNIAEWVALLGSVRRTDGEGGGGGGGGGAAGWALGRQACEHAAAVLWSERARALDETEIEGSAEIPQILFRIVNKILRARRRRRRRLPSSRLKKNSFYL